MYKNAKEIMEALLAGKKIRNTMWEKDDYVHIKDGKLLANDDEENNCFQPNLYYSWEEYVEKPKKLKFYKLSNNKTNEVYIVSAASKKDARKTVTNWISVNSRNNLYHINDIDSVKLTKCERVYIKNNTMLSTTESYIDPKEIL